MVFAFICLVNCVSRQIKHSFEENCDKFASEGFGFKYDLLEYESRAIFVKNHGNPIKATIKPIINRHTGLEDRIITLEYDNFVVEFYEWNGSFDEIGTKSRLEAIISKDNIEYLYGIKHGMTKEELDAIIGVSEIVERNFIWVIGKNEGNIAWIFMKDNKIDNIIWYYTLE
jgi:hypothetical protein